MPTISLLRMNSAKSFKVFIIGMPGAGKTTAGKELAQLFGLPFTDLDDVIVEAHGPIPEIFAHKGEATFRYFEKEVLETICAQEAPGIIATGGGTPCFDDNMDRMKTCGIVVFIDTPLVEIVARLSRKTGRPLIDHQDSVKERIFQLWESRKEFYQRADIVSKNLDVAELKKRIELYIQSA